MDFKKFYLQEKDIPDKIAKRFGKILFGVFRQKPAGKPEEDTELESDYMALISQFIDGDFMRKGKSSDLEKALKELIKLKEYYPILKPNTNKLKRVVRYNPRSHLYLLQQMTEWDLKKKEFHSKGKAVYNPQSPVQSWSPDIEKFLKSEGTSQDFIIIDANIRETQLLFDMNFLNDMNKSAGFSTVEDEIIRFSDKRVKGRISIRTKTPSSQLLNRIMIKDLYDVAEENLQNKFDMKNWPPIDKVT